MDLIPPATHILRPMSRMRPAQNPLSLRTCVVCGRLPHATVVVSIPGRDDLATFYCQRDLPDLDAIRIITAPLASTIVLVAS